MAVQPLRNVVLPPTVTVDGSDNALDLPVNPIKVIYYTLLCTQAVSTTTTDLAVQLYEMLNYVTRLEVLFRGTTIVSGGLQDLAFMTAVLTKWFPHMLGRFNAATIPIGLTIPIYLGRPRNKADELFPATRRGELVLRRVFATTPTTITAGSIYERVDTVEYLGAIPKAFLKYVTIAKTFTAAGDNDIDFPLGNPILGALLMGHTGLEAAPPAATWQQIKLLVDGVEWTYALTAWELLNAQLAEYLERVELLQDHVHMENLAAAYAQDNVVTSAQPAANLDSYYGYLDFDEFRDDTVALQTAGRGRVWLRVTSPAADAARMLPLERVDLAATA
jgi:hypothetical protein